jgi:FkbM family methyltransferase
MIKSLVERIPFLAVNYRALRDLQDRNRPFRQTPWGFGLCGNDIMSGGAFERAETELIRDLLQDDREVLVNVGANVGYYCCHALSLGKRVVAIEPVARNLHYLIRNISDNGWAAQAEIFPVAVGERSGILDLWGGGTAASLIKGWAGTSETYVSKVPILTLDRILGGSLSGQRALIVIDVEGAELAVLRGAATTLHNSPRPYWMVEVQSAMNQPRGIRTNPGFSDTFRVFFDLGYRAYTADDQLIPITHSDVDAIARREMHLSVHNYLFR